MNHYLIGYPISNTKIYILDEYLQLLPVGIIGEIYVSGVGLARGYLNRPQLTTERFIDNPFGEGRLYKTGDKARYLPDGNIEYLGRIDNQVKIRGFRIELGEIESNINQHPEVKDIIVIARENQKQDKYLVAYIIPKDNQQIKVSKLREYLKEKLPDYMIPTAFVFLDSFPLTPNGKIDKKTLPEPDLSDYREEYIVPTKDIEIKLANIWQVLLDVEKVGINDNFFNLGGHSLLATQVLSRIRNQLDIEFPLRYLFEYPTIKSLSEYIIMLDNLSNMNDNVIDEGYESMEF